MVAYGVVLLGTVVHHALDTEDEQLNTNRVAQQKVAELDRKYTQ